MQHESVNTTNVVQPAEFRLHVCSGAADESLRFWKIFELPPAKKTALDSSRGLKVSSAFGRVNIR
jgi:WD40 repeat protein